MTKKAVIDLGTNTVILLIADIKDDGSLDVLHDEAVVVRLGEGLYENLEFQIKAMARTILQIQKFKDIILKHEISLDSVTLLGTAACRNARNSEFFMQRLKKDTGISLQIISGQEEARIIFEATQKDFFNVKSPFFVLDIGYFWFFFDGIYINDFIILYIYL